jgi:hypothetical protein
MANEKAGFDLPFSLARLVETRNGATAKAGKRLRWSVFSAGDLKPENLEAEGESRPWHLCGYRMIQRYTFMEGGAD